MTFLLCKHRTWEDVAGQKLFGMCGVGGSQFSVLRKQNPTSADCQHSRQFGGS